MDWHIKATRSCSRARSEFKHMEQFLLPQLPVRESLEAEPPALDDTTPTWDVLHTYPHDYKVIFVGDASMSPYEVMAPGGSVEHYNEETGAVWMERVARTYPACVWLNPGAGARLGRHPVDPLCGSSSADGCIRSRSRIGQGDAGIVR